MAITHTRLHVAAKVDLTTMPDPEVAEMSGSYFIKGSDVRIEEKRVTFPVVPLDPDDANEPANVLNAAITAAADTLEATPGWLTFLADVKAATVAYENALS